VQLPKGRKRTREEIDLGGEDNHLAQAKSLETRIVQFQRKAHVFLGILESDDDLDQWADGNDGGMKRLVDVALCFPSSLGHADCVKRGKRRLMEKEAELRIGEANDALEAIRVALAHKSLVFRRDVKTASNQKQTTCA